MLKEDLEYELEPSVLLDALEQLEEALKGKYIIEKTPVWHGVNLVIELKPPAKGVLS